MNADAKTVAQKAVKVFDRVQDETPEIQLLTLAAAFILLAESAGIPTQDVYTAILNLMYDPLHNTGRKHQFAALKQYLKEDVL